MLQEKYKREAAQKVSAAEILAGVFEEAEDGTTALNANDRQVRRANLLATIVDKADTGGAYKSMVADDGTGQILLRFFDSETGLFEKSQIGDFTLIIGKPRHYGDDTYLAPEIIRALDNVKWAEVRKLELKIAGKKPRAVTGKTDDKKPQVPNIDVVSRDKIEVYNAIRALDSGRGADITEVATKCGRNAEMLIREMTKSGDLFEVSPGRLKVLE